MLGRPLLLSIALALAIPRTALGGPGARVEIRELIGDPGGRTTDEIMRVLKARGALLRACYQRELNRTPGLGGKLVVTFKLAPDGKPTTARIDSRSTVRHASLESCIQRQLLMFKFRASGKPASLRMWLLLSTQQP